MRICLLILSLFLISSSGYSIDSLQTVKDTTKCNCHTPLAPTPTFDNTHTYISLSPLLSESYAENTVQLDAELQVNSNSVLTTFAASFLFNKTITDDNKKASLLFGGKQLKYQDELKTGITYKHYFKKSGVGIYVSYYHRNTRSLVTTRDAFELLFYGNKKFEDKTADLSNIHFENMMYNQYSIGISKSDGHFYIGANLSFLQGFNDQQLTNTKGGLYTATYGEYLDLSYNMTFNQSNTDASKFFDLNGTGFSADLQLGYNTERSRFSFTVQDLGSISWNKKAINYTGDTTIHYDGIAFNNITNITGGGLSGINLDSTINALVPSKTAKSYSTFLPATIQFTYSRLFKLKKHSMILTAGINTKILPNYYAYGFVKTTFLLGQNWSTGVSAGGGGYSLFNLGVDVGKKWRNLDFILGTSNLIGSILPMYYPGSSVYLRVAAHF